MLSNPSSSLLQRQRQHRRQNSTPTALQAPKVPLLPTNIPLQQNGSQKTHSHRRGQSLDLRPSQSTPRLTNSLHHSLQDDSQSVSMNPRLQLLRRQQQQQHVLRETQQQRLLRPGQPQQAPAFGLPSGQGFEAPPPDYFEACLSTSNDLGSHIPFFVQQDPVLRNHLAQSQSSGRLGLGPLPDNTSFDTDCYQDNVAAYLDGCNFDFDENLRSSRREYAGRTPGGSGLKRTQSQRLEATKRWSRDQMMRPSTPPQQSTTGDLPITPESVPYGHIPHTVPANRRSIVFPMSGDDTIKPRPRTLQRAGTCQDLYEVIKRKELESALPSPPGTASLAPSSTFDMAPMPSSDLMNMDTLNGNVSASDNEIGDGSSYYSPLSAALSPSPSSVLSSPEMEQLQLFTTPFDPLSPLAKHGATLPISHTSANLNWHISSDFHQLPSRSLSVADLNLDASIKDTGITVDDISTFISDPSGGDDDKWTCLFPSCGKRFGRKENIKSHVQTHLGDRQYRCNRCRKCFVRQHDLKRHAKIHSGVKPYPCACGNSFARHDALTRHRQRGMCIGGVEGVVKKIVKRGRPRKHRPDEEERREKSNKMRVHRAIAMSQTSSSEGYQSSQGKEYEGSIDSREMSPLELLTQSFDDPTSAITGRLTPPPRLSLSPALLGNPFVAPALIQHARLALPAAAGSPSRSLNRHSITTIPEEGENDALPADPLPSIKNLAQSVTTPDLYLSSSSPHSGSGRPYNEATSPIGPRTSVCEGAESGDALAAFDFGFPGIEESGEDLFLDFEGGAGMLTKADAQLAFEDVFGRADGDFESAVEAQSFLF